MIQEQVLAEDNLMTFSQQTQYIKQWHDPKKFKKAQMAKPKETIPQQTTEQLDKINCHIKRPIRKETVNKFDLKKCQKRLQNINKAQYPLGEANLLAYQEMCTLPICKASISKQIPSAGIFKKRQCSVKNNLYKVFQAQFVQKKLELFKKKHIESQNDIRVRLIHSKSKSVPKFLNTNSKRNIKLQNFIAKQRCQANEQQIQYMKRIILKSKKKFSIPQMIQAMNDLHI